MPLYYFEPEGTDWDNDDDHSVEDDGIELTSNAEALVYAYSSVRELKADGEGSDLPAYLLVKNYDHKTIFRVAV